MQAILVRHGETEYNAQGLLQGYSPVPLSPRGRQQAMLVGPLQDGKWEIVTLNDIGHLESLV